MKILCCLIVLAAISPYGRATRNGHDSRMNSTNVERHEPNRPVPATWAATNGLRNGDHHDRPNVDRPGEMDAESKRDCYKKFIRKGYMSSKRNWQILTRVQLDDEHRSFMFNVTFPKSCCYKIVFFSQEADKQDSTCMRRDPTSDGLYLKDLSATARSRTHWCKVIPTGHGKKENITCRGKMVFDPTEQRSNTWYVAASKCDSTDGMEMAYLFNFTSPKDKCSWKDHHGGDKDEHDLSRKEKLNDAEDKGDIKHQTKPKVDVCMSISWMVGIGIVTGLNALLLVLGFSCVYFKFKALNVENGRAYNAYSVNPIYGANTEVPNEKQPI